MPVSVTIPIPLALIALKLKEVFGLDDVNSFRLLTISLGMSRRLLSCCFALLSLGIKNIHIGPTLPGFVSPNVLKVLIDNFGLGTITTVEEDLKTMVDKPLIT